MAESYQIEYTPNGIRIDADGFKGGACEKELEEIQKFLADHGIETGIEDKKKKAESFSTDFSTNTSTNRGW